MQSRSYLLYYLNVKNISSYGKSQWYSLLSKKKHLKVGFRLEIIVPGRNTDIISKYTKSLLKFYCVKY